MLPATTGRRGNKDAAGVNPAAQATLVKKKRAAPEAALFLWVKNLRAGLHAPAGLHAATVVHPELVLVREEPQRQAADDDGDQESDDVKPRQRDLVDDLIDDFEDRVEDQRS